MKFRSWLVFVFILLSLSLSACGSITGFNLEPSRVPTKTVALSIQVWGQPLFSYTPTSTSSFTPAPPTATLPPPTRTVTPTPTPQNTPTLPTPSVSPSLTTSPTPSPMVSPTQAPTIAQTVVQTPGDVDSAITTMIFTGALVPARCVQAAIDERGDPDFIYADIKDLISDADLTVGLLNAALSDYPPHTGWCEDSSFVLVGRAENANAISRAGFDVMSVSTNHIKNCGLSNCGDITFVDTLENLRNADVLPVGGGMNEQEALKPVVITLNGIRFGFIALSSYYVAEPFASASKPGIARLTEENLLAAIAEAKRTADVVIFLPHWGADYPTTLNEDQRDFSKIAVNAGVDLVIGNHPHILQGMQTIQDVPVFYSLGSFVFDQDWSLETQQGLVVRVTFQGTKVAWYDVIPVHIDGNGHVKVASPSEAADILIRFQQLSAALE